MATHSHSFALRDLLTIITGQYMSVDKARVKHTIGYLTGSAEWSMRDKAKTILLAKLQFLGEGLPDLSTLKGSAAQRALLDWAHNKITSYVSRHGNEIVEL